MVISTSLEDPQLGKATRISVSMPLRGKELSLIAEAILPDGGDAPVFKYHTPSELTHAEAWEFSRQQILLLAAAKRHIDGRRAKG